VTTPELETVITNHKIMSQRLDSLHEEFKALHADVKNTIQQIKELGFISDRLCQWYEKQEGVSL
jgi:uncharacterized protein (UPF0335 family)